MSADAIDRAPRTAVQALRTVRDLLAVEGAWLDGRSFGALDCFARPVDSRSPEARRWGVLAALRSAGGSLDLRVEAYDLLCRAVGMQFFSTWEEATGRRSAEVLAALDTAIALGAALGAGEAA